MIKGSILLFGSGATTYQSNAIIRKYLSTKDHRLSLAVLETPAGFQPNAAQLAREVVDYFSSSMNEHISHAESLPIRALDTYEYSPNNPALVRHLDDFSAYYIGAGSPTYLVKQLHLSKSVQAVQENLNQGATLILSSAGTIAAGTMVLPVYEIYKVGEPLHWETGLDFMKDILPNTVFLAHWNNNDGGEKLDTSCCYMGQERWMKLRTLLPDHMQVFAIDEHTGVVIDPSAGVCAVSGVGNAYVIRNGDQIVLHSGNIYRLPTFELNTSLTLEEYLKPCRKMATKQPGEVPKSQKIQELLHERNHARDARDFAKADKIREELFKMGYQVQDTSVRS